MLILLGLWVLIEVSLEALIETAASIYWEYEYARAVRWLRKGDINELA